LTGLFVFNAFSFNELLGHSLRSSACHHPLVHYHIHLSPKFYGVFSLITLSCLHFVGCQYLYSEQQIPKLPYGLLADVRTMINLQPTLVGETLLLSPLQPEHWQSLMLAASDPLIWQLHPEPRRYLPEVFQTVFAGGLQSGGAFLIRDKFSQEVLGTSRFYDFDAAKQDLAIGYTFLIRTRWGGATNAELKQLMLTHAFGFVETVWFHVGEHNLRSRRAVEKLGAIYQKIAQESANGQVRPTVFYALSKQDWQRQSQSIAG
jgi:RimJ/RimL family protein N-acetyltransferase